MDEDYKGSQPQATRGLAMILALLLVSPSPAAIRHVPSDHATIQAAINAATHGDEIVVSPGTYRENIQFQGKNIVLRSTAPTSPSVVAATIIDGCRSGPVVTFSGTELTTCVLSGFTITNGSKPAAFEGAGICGRGNHATIQFNVIEGNSNWGYAARGGGIAHCHGLIENNVISHNSVNDNGGIYDGDGGGLYECGGTIQNNIISDNSASAITFAHGGGLFRCGGLIQNNVIAGNSAGEGGGLYGCDGVIRNNTIYGNSAGLGGGLCVCHGTIRNCIIWGNNRGQVWDFTPPGEEPLPPPTYCCIEGGAAGEGNISSDPRLTDPAQGDFHLLDSSPCIDAGGAVALTQDFEGDPRPRDFTPVPRGDGSNFDIGADELSPPSPYIAFVPVIQSRYVAEGTDASTQTLTVWNAGPGTLSYVVETTPSWLAAIPPTGVSDGPASPTDHQIVYPTVSLPAGDHAATLTIAAAGALNSPVRIPQNLKIGSATVLTPAGGATWFAGATRQIEWESHGVCDRVHLDLRRPGFYRYLTSAANQEGSNSCSVRLPQDLPEAGNYVIRVSWLPCPTIIYDESSAFAIKPLFTGIAWPTSGTIWQVGTSGTVTWTCVNLPASSQVDVELWKGGTFVRHLTRAGCQNGTNTATVLLSAELIQAADYQIRLRWVEDASLSVWSDFFLGHVGVIFVPQGCSTIQKAIDIAVGGDTIIVSARTYKENIHFRGKNLVVRSTDPTSPSVVARTIIDGQQSGSAVTFAGNEGTTCVLAGFTITRGSALVGGGICGNGTHATIRANTIGGNLAYGKTSRGGGLYDCDGLIERNTISGNSVGTPYQGESRGGGLHGCDGSIENNLISGNGASTSRWGGAYGGGLAECQGAILNNTIFGNSCGGSVVASGGGLFSCRGTIRNCIIWKNVAESSRQLDGCSTPSYSCIEGWSGAGTGTLSLDPRLADPDRGDFHLLFDSPCIDAGGTVTLTQDLEGDSRPIDAVSAPRGDGSDFDIGADEVVPVPLIGVFPAALANCARPGTNAATQTLDVWNAGLATLPYTIQTSPSWLAVAPSAGVSDGPASRTTHAIVYQTALLPPGNHGGILTITDPAARNSPVTIPVGLTIGSLTIISPVGGDSWAAGALREIVWESHGPCTLVYIYLVGPGLSRYLTSAPNHDGINNAVVCLPLDLPPGSDYAIRIYWATTPGIQDDIATFTVVPPPTFAVTWPTTGAVWQVGTVDALSWTCRNWSGSGRAYVDLWKGGKYQRYWTAVPVHEGDNRIALRLPPNLAAGPEYQIRLSWTENAAICSWSARFRVIGATERTGVPRFGLYR